MALINSAFTIVRYRWIEYAANQRLLRETKSQPVTFIVRECRLHGSYRGMWHASQNCSLGLYV